LPPVLGLGLGLGSGFCHLYVRIYNKKGSRTRERERETRQERFRHEKTTRQARVGYIAPEECEATIRVRTALQKHLRDNL
jgi:hypothetical protein